MLLVPPSRAHPRGGGGRRQPRPWNPRGARAARTERIRTGGGRSVRVHRYGRRAVRAAQYSRGRRLFVRVPLPRRPAAGEGGRDSGGGGAGEDAGAAGRGAGTNKEHRVRGCPPPRRGVRPRGRLLVPRGLRGAPGVGGRLPGGPGGALGVGAPPPGRRGGRGGGGAGGDGAVALGAAGAPVESAPGRRRWGRRRRVDGAVRVAAHRRELLGVLAADASRPNGDDFVE